MLRPFKHTSSKFYKINSFVNHLFLDVVFRANSLEDDEFNSNLLLPKYRGFVENINEDYILNPINECYKICKTISYKDLKVLRRGVHNNARIRELCNNLIIPLQYSDIDKIHPELSKHLKKFFNYLYDDVIGRAPVYGNYERIEDFYKSLIGRSLTCRCCGTGKILNKFHSKRSALDHYLPRNHYPFLSINCNNLIPICDTCNSKYKLGQDTLFEEFKRGKKNISRERRKAFYPYCRTSVPISIKVTFNVPYSEDILPEEIDIDFESSGYEEQLETWERLFGIKENYKADICSEDTHMYYEEQLYANSTYGITMQDYIELLKNTDTFYDKKFLRIGMLEAINNIVIP